MQKKCLAIIILLFWIFHPLWTIAQEAPQNAMPDAPSIAITEIAAFEPNETEWIEIYNKSEMPIDVTGWKFFEDETNHSLNVFRGDFLLDPNEYAVIANKADFVAQKYPEFIGTLFDSSWSSLKEDGEEIGIKDADGNFLERFIYPQTGSSTSLERIDVNIPATELTNWASHPAAHSIGRAREILEIVEPVEIGTTTEIGTSTEPLGPSSAPPADSSTAPTVALTAPIPPPQPSPPAPPPPNLPPQAVIQIQSGSLTAQGETTINFDGRASFDPDGNRLNFFWDFGDGTTSNSENPGFHKYSVPGFYTVSLTVTDSAGASGKNYQYVQVLNKPVFSAPATQSPPAPPRSSSTPPDGSSIPPARLYIPPFSPPTSTLSPQLIELRGYFVFEIPSVPSIAAPSKKQKLSVKKKSQKKKTQKTASNGDLSQKIKITEIFPDPEKPNEEWIEIFNEGKQTVNLGNWMLADLKKTSSPYLIPDTFDLQPEAYAVFQKSATRINLNNEGDTVFLADFEGNVVDSVTYEGMEKNASYALIEVATGNDLVASTATLIGREHHETMWEWTDELTPGAANPSREKIEGRVSTLLTGGDFENDLQNGASKKIRFSSDLLDPLMANVLMDDIRPAREERASDIQKNSWILWVALGVLVMSFLLNGIPLFLALKRWRASRGARLSETSDSQKDENSSPER